MSKTSPDLMIEKEGADSLPVGELVAWHDLATVHGASPLIENNKDGSLLVLVPGGTFLAGGSGSDEGGGKPFPVELHAFYLAVHPVTNAQYARFLCAVKPREVDLKKWVRLDSDCFVKKSRLGGCYEAYDGKEVHPVEVTWWGAEAYCSWAGLRMPRELEWERGARGTDGREYPWGNQWLWTKCHHAQSKGRESTASVWSYGAGVSPSGCQQMAGNVGEWCSDGCEGDAYERYKEGDLRPSKETARRVVRGGSRKSFNTDLRCNSRNDGRPDFSYGFRVARSVL